jgi:hypothetical protein
MSNGGVLAFSEELREDLSHGKYTDWATDLTEEQVFVLLWAVGEFGGRAYNEEIEARSGPGPSESMVKVRFSGSLSAVRAAVGLRIMARYNCRQPLTRDELNAAIRHAVANIES